MSELAGFMLRIFHWYMSWSINDCAAGSAASCLIIRARLTYCRVPQVVARLQLEHCALRSRALVLDQPWDADLGTTSQNKAAAALTTLPEFLAMQPLSKQLVIMFHNPTPDSAAYCFQTQQPEHWPDGAAT